MSVNYRDTDTCHFATLYLWHVWHTMSSRLISFIAWCHGSPWIAGHPSLVSHAIYHGYTWHHSLAQELYTIQSTYSLFSSNWFIATTSRWWSYPRGSYIRQIKLTPVRHVVRLNERYVRSCFPSCTLVVTHAELEIQQMQHPTRVIGTGGCHSSEVQGLPENYLLIWGIYQILFTKVAKLKLQAAQR